MARTLLVCAALAAAAACGCGTGGGRGRVELRGAGASFPAALYKRWFDDYTAAHPQVRIAYEATGSGAGVKAVLAGAVDFGASDAAMTEEEMAKVKHGVLLLPMTAGNVVLAYNLPGVKTLRLSRAAYVGIFRGTVTRWDDPLIRAANPDLSLPDRPVRVVVRGDNSGTTFAFTTHLAAVSKEFAAGPGVGARVKWPTGTASDGSAGLIHQVHETEGAIGYAEQGLAEHAGLPAAVLENRAGRYIAPTPAAAQEALASLDLFEDLIGWIPDPAPAAAYPIVTFTWLICYKVYDDPGKAHALRDLLGYCLDEGQDRAAPLGYVPLPRKVVRRVRTLVKQIHGREARKDAPAGGGAR
jgi:phosphate transport system substrate-binding protein